MEAAVGGPCRVPAKKTARAKAASCQQTPTELRQLLWSKSRSKQLIAHFTSPFGNSEHSSTDQS
jgi:hypothetical protein